MAQRSHVSSVSRVTSSTFPANRIARTVAGAQTAEGRPLPASTRAPLERSVNTDLSGVRIYTGASSDHAARAMGARAFTMGRDIHFKSGEYNPTSRSGFQLLAHEVVHTITHGDAGRHTSPSALEISKPDESAERHATAAAASIAAGQRTHVPRGTSNSPARIFRDVDRTALEADRVAEELKTLIAGATWSEIRKRVYPKESAAGITRSNERKAGTRPELTGLGRIKNLEHLATSIRGVQSSWSTMTAEKRIKAITKAANDELADADVPSFLVSDKIKTEFKAIFRPGEWGLFISDALVSSSSLNDVEGADLANTTMHESRHAEQDFLAARFQAGVNKKTADEIVAENGLPKTIANKAVAKKFDAGTDAGVVDLGRRMFDATITDRAKNSAISTDDGLNELARKRAAARSALINLASKTPENVSAGKLAASELSQQITDVEQRYTAYRNIPYEADAHEVGDAAEEAFKGWPGVTKPGPKSQKKPEREPEVSPVR